MLSNINKIIFISYQGFNISTSQPDFALANFKFFKIESGNLEDSYSFRQMASIKEEGILENDNR